MPGLVRGDKPYGKVVYGWKITAMFLKHQAKGGDKTDEHRYSGQVGHNLLGFRSNSLTTTRI